MARLKVPILCIVIGEGSSGGALAIGVADKILMLENAIYSILSPEGFASILYKDATKNKQAAKEMKITAQDLKDFNIIDEIIKEPEGGAQNSLECTAKTMKSHILKNLRQLQEENIDTLLEKRYSKYRNIGRQFIENRN